MCFASGAGLKIPKYDISGALKEVDEVFTPILKEAKELEEFSAKRAKEIEAEIAAVDRDIVRWPVLTRPYSSWHLYSLPATVARRLAAAAQPS